MTDTIQPTIVRDTGDLLAALQARQRLLGWSNEFVYEVAGLDVAAVFEQGRRPSCSTLDALLALFAVDLELVPAPSKAAVLTNWWSGDRASRAEPFRSSERARRAAMARWSRSTPEQRSAAARHAISARWSKERSS